MLSAEETKEVHKTIQGIEDAWNRSDAAAYGPFLISDGEWINIIGMRWRGKEAVIKSTPPTLGDVPRIQPEGHRV